MLELLDIHILKYVDNKREPLGSLFYILSNTSTISVFLADK